MFSFFKNRAKYPVGATVYFGEYPVRVVRRGRGGSVRLSIGRSGEIRLSAGLLVDDDVITRFCEERVARLVARWRSHPQPEPMPFPSAEQIAALQAWLPDRYRYWRERMGVTDEVPFRYSKARSYWGKCYPVRRSVVFSLYLAATEPAHIDYVIVHELAHLFVPHHNAAFYALVAQYIPDYARFKRNKMCVK